MSVSDLNIQFSFDLIIFFGIKKTLIFNNIISFIYNNYKKNIQV